MQQNNYKIEDNSVCNEFKHFNGGIVLYNYVKNKYKYISSYYIILYNENDI